MPITDRADRIVPRNESDPIGVSVEVAERLETMLMESLDRIEKLVAANADLRNQNAFLVLEHNAAVRSNLATRERMETHRAQVNAYLAAGVSWDGSGWVNTRALRVEAKLEAVKKVLETAGNDADAEVAIAIKSGDLVKEGDARSRRAAIMSVAVPCVVEIARLP